MSSNYLTSLSQAIMWCDRNKLNTENIEVIFTDIYCYEFEITYYDTVLKEMNKITKRFRYNTDLGE